MVLLTSGGILGRNDLSCLAYCQKFNPKRIVLSKTCSNKRAIAEFGGRGMALKKMRNDEEELKFGNGRNIKGPL